MGTRLVDEILTALDEQTVVVPGTTATETVLPKLADSLKVPIPAIQAVCGRHAHTDHPVVQDEGPWPGPQIKSLLHDIEALTPAFVWPVDHEWCVTCDIDPHFASIGSASDAIDRLVADPRVDAVVDDPDTEPPYYS